MPSEQSIRDKKLLYHLTCIDNLESIIDTGLRSRSSLKGNFKDVADGEIIQGRGAKALEEMVPFHFFAGNPFDGRVLVDNKTLEFCMITVQRNVAQKNKWKILPKHPLASEGVELMDYDKGMKSIDWEVMDKRDYKDTNCKLVCMAECLSTETVLPSSFFCIYVKDASAKKRVEQWVKDKDLNFYIDIMESFCHKK
ncbi:MULTISPECIES: DarT ssDNA thymidine ADP-ribosyltransferase family protein [Pectobacterium]|uniref:DarT domain-containing protein n=1 Tax=Pectobacterium carotovorum subsp. carotovorum TaxID=555 RepID=A0AAI9KVF5_PECCC|nr:MULTISPECIES: DarT ssDNA thymidine ADP-ribosyltransferase family protein [Pectobacterium]MCA6962533.1 DUF4433 domain-containing protein [Pectobacterium odoriferum]MCH5010628.1 DUF4433 domain-containing protein [Pectobacterium odoriferum]GKX45260.1 hypothetical protein SOASR016_00120 [Pectobacterium carotovorum subsp. carotovorum]GLV67568.1 hypothetical protein Pcaca03_00120 [Pectobacterium carotovorum subsp. carotovorum]